jgi:hypothetical protein
MKNQGKRKQQQKDSALFTYIGIVGGGFCFITMWVIAVLESCG